MEGSTATSHEEKTGTQMAEHFCAEVVCAPNTAGDPQSGHRYKAIGTKTKGFLVRSVAGTVWGNHLALGAAVLSAHNLDEATVLNYTRRLHRLLRQLIPFAGVQSLSKWDANQAFVQYLTGELVTKDSQTAKVDAYKAYVSTHRHLASWLKSLSPDLQQQYSPLVLPRFYEENFKGIVPAKEVTDDQQRKRKRETEAIVHRLPQLVAEAHFRYNLYVRVREAYLKAIREVESGRENIPCLVHLSEGGDPDKGIAPKEVLTFRLWDRRTLVLQHRDCYSRQKILEAEAGHGLFAPDNPSYFFEFLGAECLDGDGIPRGLWFAELAENGVLGTQMSNIKLEKRQQAQLWLKAAGYDLKMNPLGSPAAGLIGWLKRDAHVVASVAETLEGVLLPIESIYPALVFGLAALDLFCSSGMRMNELLQIRSTPECFVTIKLAKDPEAAHKPAEVHHAFRLIPKGERLDKPKNFWVGLDAIRMLSRLGHLLEEHYRLGKEDTLPSVAFSASDCRQHRFDEQPYMFQWNRQHLSQEAITSCMRLLVHGMAFQTTDGESVVIKAHLLRHSFATWAVQDEKVPIDVVATILHQKDIGVTRYYAQATERQVANSADLLIARHSSFIDMGQVLVRAPEHIKRLIEDAMSKRGTLLRVIGGSCTFEGACAAKFACVGCPAKAVDPSRRAEVEEYKQWNESQAEWAKRDGFKVNRDQHEQQVRYAELELQEMDLIEAYQEDESREPSIDIKPNS